MVTKTAAKTPTKEVKKPKAKPAVTETASKADVDPRNPLERRRTMEGLVVSNKMQKTIVVEIDRSVRHGLYAKYLVRSNRYKVHDEKNDAKVGDRVSMVESKPLSKGKRWVLQKVLRRAGQVAEANV
jgi:small subunit ribosomal protein S17